MNSQRGSALLLVLWALALLIALMTSTLSNVRLENRQSAYLLNQTRALNSAQAGVTLAVAGLLSPDKTVWAADGHPHELRFDNAALTVIIESEAGKLDLNSAQPSLYPPLLTELGASEPQVQAFMHAMATRRKDQQPILTLEDVQTFEGMTPALYEGLLPNITLWSSAVMPSAAFATQALRKALPLDTVANDIDPGTVLTVRSRAQLENRFAAGLTVTLEMNTGQMDAPLYRVLRWQE